MVCLYFGVETCLCRPHTRRFSTSEWFLIGASFIWGFLSEPSSRLYEYLRSITVSTFPSLSVLLVILPHGDGGELTDKCPPLLVVTTGLPSRFQSYFEEGVGFWRNPLGQTLPPKWHFSSPRGRGPTSSCEDLTWYQRLRRTFRIIVHVSRSIFDV